jgi:hypothetical protein
MREKLWCSDCLDKQTEHEREMGQREGYKEAEAKELKLQDALDSALMFMYYMFSGTGEYTGTQEAEAQLRLCCDIADIDAEDLIKKLRHEDLKDEEVD